MIQKACVRCCAIIAKDGPSLCPRCKRADRVRGKARVQERRKILALYDNRCAAVIDGERCEVRAPLEIHHIDGDRRNDAFENKVPLCRPHHREFAGMPAQAFADPVPPWVA